MLVCGDYILTVHQERVSLPELLRPTIPEGRSEQYAVYAILTVLLVRRRGTPVETDQDTLERRLARVRP